MLVMMRKNHSPEELNGLLKKIEKLGYTAHVLPGEHSLAVGITGNHSSVDREILNQMPGVREVIPVSSPYKLAGRSFHPEDSIFEIGPARFGSSECVIMAGPCAVESEEQTVRLAHAVKAGGAQILRGGAYKPRTSPYAFQGLGIDGLKILATARAETGLPVISEALDLPSLEAVYEYADIIQIGTRNMQNFSLLKAASQLDKPVLLKRGLSATIDEWLMAAEYLLAGGNERVILCERGLRHYDPHTRNLLDLGAVLAVRKLSHLPIVVDPSHSLGHKSMVVPASRAAVAIGAHGLLVDVHDRPQEALCDGPQAISPEMFSAMVKTLRQIEAVLQTPEG
ncbi:3-deoxy-7-phosphoheptulonate synthase [bacterium (Candidatus Blackallbacteria) CG17_big_fil_post_rev_8_21_14_2_50_48_46]|uniref:3-deoxy-7-phosphoheptulonate synthase n=1 Tax=bacterium (Candidatus Blackallbacteria) CG17_big_fil_post_rev_8_21_14_2_50_48_46 TaxID=2014261 RepID=A0A2M7FYZ0_9BACT|nr:MAG: 3-deoxy-7-phosphoheptulonate synthase [bacterium (Candidatus Blackallbacteria) CG18_big_fil_WC_8_21_14_2_50_49_26]PIW14310.1 MAG: 3-deoxy-7-phosphoheptulonate synthase [bacterium (Candidatus Blackallbacteria) CG17_big_fil_post_rev_8_21_14_2_50_48_46]PIW45579.1 MAG: 3-deoxy-7-phosphoheptulonate synthase [bacterium (Candidatus Blackallbacteria) CG13_big_fil_rev_8_21_14_2_50_49_14]